MALFFQKTANGFVAQPLISISKTLSDTVMLTLQNLYKDGKTWVVIV